MSTKVLRPQHLTPRQLDAYLERGWYRIGQTLMTCWFVLSNDTLRSAVWTRLPLDGHTFTRNQRKLLGRLDRRFRITEGPAIIDEARQALYTRYLTTARGDRAPTLQDFRYGSATHDIFATREIALWEDDRLVAFSWFDLGRDSLQSLIGVYDPDYRTLSLGAASMFLEIRYGVENGYKFHYTGYILPGEPAMDYKLRAGALEFLDMEDYRWRPIEQLDRDTLPTRRLQRNLSEAQDTLRKAGVPSVLREYPMFEAPAYEDQLARCLADPLLLEVETGHRGKHVDLVTYDLLRRAFVVNECVRVTGRMITPSGEERSVPLWLVASRRGGFSDPDALVNALIGSPAQALDR